jgi:hypothetical protein
MLSRAGAVPADDQVRDQNRRGRALINKPGERRHHLPARMRTTSGGRDAVERPPTRLPVVVRNPAARRLVGEVVTAEEVRARRDPSAAATPSKRRPRDRVLDRDPRSAVRLDANRGRQPARTHVVAPEQDALGAHVPRHAELLAEPAAGLARRTITRQTGTPGGSLAAFPHQTTTGGHKTDTPETTRATSRHASQAPASVRFAAETVSRMIARVLA